VALARQRVCSGVWPLADVLIYWYVGVVREGGFPVAGAVAQLGERLHGMQEVVGSIPIGSTFWLIEDKV
jgi:hypothetical protein